MNLLLKLFSKIYDCIHIFKPLLFTTKYQNIYNFSLFIKFMLDIRYVKNNSVQIKESIKKRNQKDKLSLVDEVTNKYNEWVKVKKQLDELRHNRNVVSEERD